MKNLGQIRTNFHRFLGLFRTNKQFWGQFLSNLPINDPILPIRCQELKIMESFRIHITILWTGLTMVLEKRFSRLFSDIYLEKYAIFSDIIMTLMSIFQTFSRSLSKIIVLWVAEICMYACLLGSLKSWRYVIGNLVLSMLSVG